MRYKNDIFAGFFVTKYTTQKLLVRKNIWSLVALRQGFFEKWAISNKNKTNVILCATVS